MSTPQSDPLPERMKRLLSTSIDADAHFLVGPEDEHQQLLHAHKLILRIASDVFDAMFRYDDECPVMAKRTRKRRAEEVCSSSNSGDPVRIPDVDVEAFKTMLEFIYTDNVDGVNGDNAIAVLYAAKKYHLPTLAKACVDIPISQLRNVFTDFDRARLLDEEDFAGRCLYYIDLNADTLLESDAFLQIDQQLLYEIFGRDQLVVEGEIVIWNAALRWADEQCRQKCLDCSTENRRRMLGSALFKIRFPIIQKDFLKDIASSGLLTNAELVSVLLYHSTTNSPDGGAVSELHPLPFCVRQRSARSTGKITLKIENFSEFSREDELSERYSEAKCIGGIQWKIFALIQTRSDIKYLGFYIECIADDYGTDWSCQCAATLRIVSQQQGKSDHRWTMDQIFEPNLQSWGYATFKSFADLMNPQNGWYVEEEEDTVILSADLVVNE